MNVDRTSFWIEDNAAQVATHMESGGAIYYYINDSVGFLAWNDICFVIQGALARKT